VWGSFIKIGCDKREERGSCFKAFAKVLSSFMIINGKKVERRR
jgi:hypothetical protein